MVTFCNSSNYDLLNFSNTIFQFLDQIEQLIPYRKKIIHFIY